MKDVTEVHLFGSLAIAQGGNPTHQLQFAIQAPMALSDFLIVDTETHGLPASGAASNGR